MFRLSQKKKKKPQVTASQRLKRGFKNGFQVAWNFLESFQLSDFNEKQSRVTERFYLGLHTRICG